MKPMRRWIPFVAGVLWLVGCAGGGPHGAVLVDRMGGAADPSPVAGSGFTLTAGDASIAMTEIAPGRFCSDVLAIQTYMLVETTVPDGYVAVPSTTVVPEVGARCTTPLPTPVVVTGAAVPADVYVWLQDGDGFPMIGEAFELTDGAGFDASCTTDEHASCAFLDVPLGSYVLHEVIPAGYVPGRLWLDGVVQVGAHVPFAFSVGLGSAPATGQTWDIGVENLDASLGGVFVEKMDDASAPAFVAGAGFTLRGGGYLVEMTEVATGRFCADGLPIEEFTLAETTVPNGYVGVLPATVMPQAGRYCAGVLPEATVVTNEAVPGDIWVWAVDDDAFPITGAGFRLTNGVGYDATCFTDEHAMCGFFDLPLGPYVFAFHSAPAGLTFGRAWLDTVPVPGLPHPIVVGPGSAPGTGAIYEFKVELRRD